MPSLLLSVMGFYVLLNCEVAPAGVTQLLAHLFAIDATAVANVLASESSHLYYEIHLLRKAAVPRSTDPTAIFFVELGVYPQGQLAAVYNSGVAFARAFSQESQLSVLVSDPSDQTSYGWLLFEQGIKYQVEEWPEDEQTAAITVTDANKSRLPTS